MLKTAPGNQQLMPSVKAHKDTEWFEEISVYKTPLIGTHGE